MQKVKSNMIKDKQLKGKTGIEIKQDTLENHPKPVYLAIGSNLGNKVININKACYLLSKYCSILNISDFYETNSWPNVKLPKYLNIVLKCYTPLNAIILLKKLKKIERKLGRKNEIRNYPRKCDIDIIDFKGICYNKEGLIIPHQRLTNRNFVLFPLFEIEKTWKHPKTNISIEKLLANLDAKSMISIKIFKK